MTSFFTSLLESNWFMGVITLIVLGTFIHFTNVGNVDGASQFKAWVDLVLGVWVGKVGTGLAIAQRSYASGASNGSVTNGK